MCRLKLNSTKELNIQLGLVHMCECCFSHTGMSRCSLFGHSLYSQFDILVGPWMHTVCVLASAPTQLPIWEQLLLPNLHERDYLCIPTWPSHKRTLTNGCGGEAQSTYIGAVHPIKKKNCILVHPVLRFTHRCARLATKLFSTDRPL